VTDRHKERVVEVARQLKELGFVIISTSGTAKRLQEAGIEVESVKKIIEGHPNLIAHMKNEDIDLIINTPIGKGDRTDEGSIRAAAVQHGVPCITTIQAAEAAVQAMTALRSEQMEVESLQERFSMV
jgi:carbamoyl-phosphate synthase large subunit